MPKRKKKNFTPFIIPLILIVILLSLSLSLIIKRSTGNINSHAQQIEKKSATDLYGSIIIDSGNMKTDNLTVKVRAFKKGESPKNYFGETTAKLDWDDKTHELLKFSYNLPIEDVQTENIKIYALSDDGIYTFYDGCDIEINSRKSEYEYGCETVNGRNFYISSFSPQPDFFKLTQNAEYKGGCLCIISGAIGLISSEGIINHCVGRQDYKAFSFCVNHENECSKTECEKRFFPLLKEEEIACMDRLDPAKYYTRPTNDTMTPLLKAKTALFNQTTSCRNGNYLGKLMPDTECLWVDPCDYIKRIYGIN